MLRRNWLRILVLPIVPVVAPLCAQDSAVWRDPSPHKVQFVTVDENVRLEVLDWGGAGRPIVLLAGMGNTALCSTTLRRSLSAVTTCTASRGAASARRASPPWDTTPIGLATT